mgnify:FL=1
MFGYVPVFAGAYLLIFGPITVPLPLLNQILGLTLMVGGPWAIRSFFSR